MPYSAFVKEPVLVVDDNEAARRIVSIIMAQIGFDKVQMADGGDQALELLQRQKIALVVSDWNMSPMNGLDLLRRVRTDIRFRDTRFILISGEASADHVIAARECGANAFILKPFNAEGLKLKIMDAFRNAGPAGAPVTQSCRPSADWALSTVSTDYARFPLARMR